MSAIRKTLTSSLKSLIIKHRSSSTISVAGGEVKKMNLFTAVNDGMRVAMKTDSSAIVFGEGIVDHTIQI